MYVKQSLHASLSQWDPRRIYERDVYALNTYASVIWPRPSHMLIMTHRSCLRLSGALNFFHPDCTVIRSLRPSLSLVEKIQHPRRNCGEDPTPFSVPHSFFPEWEIQESRHTLLPDGTLYSEAYPGRWDTFILITWRSLLCDQISHLLDVTYLALLLLLNLTWLWVVPFYSVNSP